MLPRLRPIRLIAVGLTAALATASAGAQDVVELLSGARLEGKVTAIRKAEREFDFATRIGQRTRTATYPFDRVHAVTLGGQRHVLTPKPAGSGGSSDRAAAEASADQDRPRAEIERLIQDVGSTPPEWYDEVELDHPPTLDLDWPIGPPEGGWNNRKNMGQYIWDIVNPNPRRWRSGIKLVHHCLSLHKEDPERLKRDMRTLGVMYFELLQDYPRAAFWLRQSGAEAGQPNGVMLAECYWRMGSRAMALEMLRARTLPIQAIKLLGDLGQTRRAVALADAAAPSAQAPEANLLAGDALRQSGELEAAIDRYRRVLDAQDFRNAEYEKLHKARARESIDAIRVFDQADVAKVADGTYRASSTGYNGALEVEVRVAGGRIEAVEITDHREKQFYSAIDDTPRRILDAQSVQGVDAISRATITSQAIVNATAEALASASRR